PGSTSAPNGPVPSNTDDAAMPEISNAAGAAPALPQRHAAQARKGNIRYSRPRWAWNTQLPTPNRDRYSERDSSRAGHEPHRRSRMRGRLSKNGTTIRMPIASPVHHTDQVAQNASGPIARDERSASV